MAAIALISVGSRGDLEPYLVLLEALQQRGHSVTLIGSTNFAQASEQAGIPFHPVPSDIRELMESELGVQLMEGKSVQVLSNEQRRQWLEAAWPVVQQCDLLLLPTLALWGYHLAEAAGCPLAMLCPFPVVATGDYPFVRFPKPANPSHSKRLRWLKRRLNKLSYTLVRLLSWRAEAKVIQAVRSELLGLNKLPWAGIMARRCEPSHLRDPLVLNLYSPHVLPPASDWPQRVQVSGYCLRETQNSSRYQPPAALEAFLAAGEAPFYAGFGSMVPRDPERIGRLLVQAAQQAGQRLLLYPGWGKVMPSGSLPETVHLLEECPHRWLFPQLRGAVHHGGAGTTGTTLACGIPSTVVAFFMDQPAWGRTLEQLGVSPATHQLLTLSADALAASLRELAHNPIYTARAQVLRDQIAREDGVGNAVAALEAVIAKV